MIRRLHRSQGMSIKANVRKLGVARNTVRVDGALGSSPRRNTQGVADLNGAWAELVTALKTSTVPEPASLFQTFSEWKAEIRNFCLTRVANARTEAANLGMKNINRAGRGNVNHGNYRARILLTATRNVAA